MLINSRDNTKEREMEGKAKKGRGRRGRRGRGGEEREGSSTDHSFGRMAWPVLTLLQQGKARPLQSPLCFQDEGGLVRHACVVYGAAVSEA
jgi:hypothetical protein